MSSAKSWVDLGAAGLRARPFRTGRTDVAFWKHLYESFEEVAIVRTAARVGDDDMIVVVVAPADYEADAEAILQDVARRGVPRVEEAELPEHCREDWFLTEWFRDEAGQGWEASDSETSSRRAKK